jgi:type II secretory pathway pseudopilin PulG
MLKRTTDATVRNRRRADEGYVLLTLLLWVALLTITVALPMLTYYNTQMKRDREEELVHRGVEYERAVRKYYKKFGGYPASIEVLEDTNHIRSLRRRYKDPITGQDFKLLHQSDVMMLFGPGIAGAQTLGQPVGSMNSGSPGFNAPNGSTTTNGSTAAYGNQAANGNTAANGSDPTAADPSQQGTNGSTSSNSPFSSISGQPDGQSFGGGPIVGVVSTSTLETIRIYNKKNHYNDWLFAYNPSQDRGGLPKGPYQPSLQAILPGQLGLPPGAQNGLGQGFGQGTGQGFGQGNMPMGQGTQPFPGKR